MAQTDVEQSVTGSTEESPPPSWDDETPTEFAAAAMKRGLSSILTSGRYLLRGLYYGIAGYIGFMLILALFSFPYGFMTGIGASEGAQLIGALVFTAVGFFLYGAGALKFERTRETGKAADGD